MKAFNKNIILNSLNLKNHSLLASFNQFTSRNFSDFQSNGIVGGNISRQFRENFVAPNGYAVFNRAGHKNVKSRVENLDKNKDFPSNSSRLSFLKGKK
jgi:hypothetical protein